MILILLHVRNVSEDELMGLKIDLTHVNFPYYYDLCHFCNKAKNVDYMYVTTYKNQRLIACSKLCFTVFKQIQDHKARMEKSRKYVKLKTDKK